MVPSKFQFAQHGKSGAWVSELLPHTAKIADQLDVHQVDAHRGDQSRSGRHVYADRVADRGPAEHRRRGCPTASGSETEDLPAFVVMISPGTGGGGQPLYDRLWGSGFLPSRYQGVKFRSVGDPVLYLSNPDGFDADDRRHVPGCARQAEPA